MTSPLLAIQNVTASYGVLPILHGLSLDINDGEIVALIGGNGAGKTTLMMTIFGRPRAREGRILFQGQDITQLPMHMIARARIVQSPEGRRIFSRMTVFENLQMGAIIADNPSGFNADLEHVYTLFPLLKARAQQRGGTLSGGEQQMLMIGRALMAKPKLLMLDEPSLGLSPILVQQVFDIIRAIHASGIAILLVEQNARVALDVSSYGFILENGEISLQGPAAELAQNPQVHEAYLGGGNATSRH
jgi:branched-chain amino acid transport system ATP-binding protein